MQDHGDQQVRVAAVVSGLRQLQQTQTANNEAAIDAQVIRWRETAEEQLSPAIGTYWSLLDTLARLHEGIEEVVTILERMNADLPDAMADEPLPATLIRERQRREHQVRTLRAKLINGANLLDRVNPQDGLDQATQSGGADPVLERRQMLLDEVRRIEDSVLTPYLKLVVLPETASLWGHRQDLAASLREDGTPEYEWWLDARDVLWKSWHEALDHAGFSLDVPAPGTKVDFTVHEVVYVEDVPRDNIESLGWEEPIEDRVWSVKRPGLRRRANDQLIQAAGVELARPFDIEPEPTPVVPGLDLHDRAADVVPGSDGTDGESSSLAAGRLPTQAAVNDGAGIPVEAVRVEPGESMPQEADGRAGDVPVAVIADEARDDEAMEPAGEIAPFDLDQEITPHRDSDEVPPVVDLTVGWPSPPRGGGGDLPTIEPVDDVADGPEATEGAR